MTDIAMVRMLEERDAEIERLRNSLPMQTIAVQQTDIARLQAALQAMVDAWDMSGDEGQHRYIWDEARAALKDTKP